MGGGGEQQGCTPSRRHPTWAPSRIHPPFLLPEGERGKEREGGIKGGCRTPLLVLFGLLPYGGRATPLWAGVPPSYGPYGPYLSLGGSGNPSGTLVCTRYTPEPFRCLNTIFQNINRYLSTISRLPIMSVISSGTPNNLWSPKYITHIIHIIIER